jgi:CheY-like chemotaxis protein
VKAECTSKLIEFILTDNTALRILVAEDNPINQKIAVAVLKNLGHTGVVVSDGEKALRCLSQLPFDLVLMDVMMPNMDGLQALAALRELEKQGRAHMPVIMLTSNDMPDDRQRFLAAGADGYLVKPLDQVQLASELLLVLRRN